MHIAEILPTAEVSRGSGLPRQLARRERNLDDLPVTTGSGKQMTLSAVLDRTYTDGFLVICNGAVAYERYFNGMAPRMLHLSQSVAKSVVGAVFGILSTRGEVDPTRLVTDYLPELSGTGWSGATLQHVLDMTTGVTFSEEYTDPYSDIGQVDVASGWKPVPFGADPAFRWPQNMWDLILGLRKGERPHGAAFKYRSIETDVLAFAMERMTGKRLPQLVSEELWQKIGAEENASFTVDSTGFALADGGFNASLRDYGRFGLAVLEGNVVPFSWVEATRRGSHGPGYSKLLPQGAYRNQFWIEDAETRNLLCRGVFGQMIYISRATGMVVVKVSSWPDFQSIPYERDALDAIHAVERALA